MRRRWGVLVVMLLLAGGAVAGVTMRGRGRPAAEATPTAPPVPVEVAIAKTGDVTRTIEVSGTVVSPRTAEVVPKISGRVSRVLVQDGMRVAAGQALITLDASDQQAEVRQAAAAVAAAEARLALVEAGQRPQERQVVFNAYTQAQNQVKAAETQVALAQAALRVAEDNLRRNEQLLRDGAIAQAQVDQARLQYDQARAQLQAAQTQLEIARTGVDSARQQWDMTQTGAREEDLRAARAQVQQARAVLALARQRLANMTIRAPFAGRVSGVTVSPGDYVVSGDFAGRSSAVAIVYDEQLMEVEVKVGERDLGLIRVGQPAVLRPEGVDGSVDAVVAVISPLADPTSRSSSVRLRLKNGGQGLVPGVFARGEIVVERRSGVVLVPKSAVVGGDQPIVRVVVAGTVEERQVTTGLTQGNAVEVRSGVAEGEAVVVLGPESLPAGTAVKVVNQ
ncbi:MAG: efflux RND transporter periplasmic adaptor subunit [Armatimonadota bacterium]|nr:efflux RND transporter periplasmic adaptor subunit [Armatimonadota bacterium]